MSILNYQTPTCAIKSSIDKHLNGSIYSLKGTDQEVVKKVKLNNVSIKSREIIETMKASVSYFNHPNVLKYRDIIWDNDSVWFVMGKHKQSLEALLSTCRNNKTPISLDTALKIFYQIVLAIAYLHTVHKKDYDGNPIPPLSIKNLKPTNILFNDTNIDGTLILVADYGLPFELTNNPLGSVYMAPELNTTNCYTLASDIWSLGSIFLEMVIGCLPDLEKDWKLEDVIINGCVPNINVDTPHKQIIEEILRGCLVLEPEKRMSIFNIVEVLETKLSHYILYDISQLFQCYYYNLILQQKEYLHQIDTLINIKMIHQSEIKELSDKIIQQESILSGLNEEQVNIDTKSNDDIQNTFIQLEKASASGNINAVKRIIYETMSSKDKEDEMTALMFAALNNYVSAVKVLLDHEAGMHNRMKRTALMLAAHAGHKDVVNLLIDYEKGCQDINSQTALMEAAVCGHVEIVKMLVEHEKGMQNKGGYTALMSAISSCRVQVVQLLAPHESTIPTYKGLTPINYAKQKGNKSIIDIISSQLSSS